MVLLKINGIGSGNWKGSSSRNNHRYEIYRTKQINKPGLPPRHHSLPLLRRFPMRMSIRPTATRMAILMPMLIHRGSDWVSTSEGRTRTDPDTGAHATPDTGDTA